MWIKVNGMDAVNESSTNTSGTIYNLTSADSIQVYGYAYGNSGIGSQVCLTVENPQGTPIYNNCDTQYSPGSPASNSYGLYYPTANGAIAVSINSV
jgi:hypothetical protein